MPQMEGKLYQKAKLIGRNWGGTRFPSQILRNSLIHTVSG